MAALSGRMLGQYELKGLIGLGGMASVNRARQESMDRDVAIKIMAVPLAENQEFVARFEREARVIAKHTGADGRCARPRLRSGSRIGWNLGRNVKNK